MTEVSIYNTKMDALSCKHHLNNQPTSKLANAVGLLCKIIGLLLGDWVRYELDRGNLIKVFCL